MGILGCSHLCVSGISVTSAYRHPLPLPQISELSEAATYHLTVAPYWSSFGSLLGSPPLRNPLKWPALYRDSNPLELALLFCLVSLVISNVLRIPLRRSLRLSVRFWTFEPSLYAVHYLLWSRVNGLPLGRIFEATISCVTWTVCMLLKRTGELNERKSDQSTWLLNFHSVVVACRPVGIFLVTSPLYVLVVKTHVEPASAMNRWPVLLTILCIALPIISLYYHKRKCNQYNATKHSLPVGTPASAKPRTWSAYSCRVLGFGLWLRHPDVAAEIGFWLLFHLMCCWAVQSIFNWAGIGFVLYFMMRRNDLALFEDPVVMQSSD